MEQEILDKGYQIVAIGPDDPEHMRDKADKSKVSYTLVSDSDMNAIKAFGLAWRLDEATIKRYDGFGINLGEYSGGGNKDILPVPAFYLVDTNGTITFEYHDPDYTKRISQDDIRAALAKD